MRFCLLFVCFGIIIFSCNQKLPSAGSQTVFRYNESKGIPTLDPAFAKNQTVIWPVNQMFNGLVQLTNSLLVAPCIARTWEISKNGKEYTFSLRNDVYFHDDPIFPGGKGRRVVASDFIYSLSRIIDTCVASPGAWIFNSVDTAKGKRGFEALNDTILKIYLKQPFPAFLGILSMQYCSVVPFEIVEHYQNDFRSHPVGTGPFMLKFWKEGEKLVMVKNPNYFEKDQAGKSLPYLDAVSISFIADKQSEFLEFVKGNLDFLSGLQQTCKDELITRSGRLNPKYSERFKMITQPYLNTEYLGFLVDSSLPAVYNNPVRLRAIRCAINYGFDRVKMMTYLRNNIGEPALHGFVPRGLPSFSEDVKGYFYCPDSSRSLLKQAGFPNGEGLPEIVLMTTSDYLDLCEYIQHELVQVGIKIRIEVSTGASFRNMVANSKLPFFRGSWIADYPDAENYMALFYSGNFSPSGPNYFHFKSQEFDQLYTKSLCAKTNDERFSLYQAMDRIIVSEAPVVPLYYDQVIRFVQSEIEGLGSNAMNLLSLKRVYRKK